MAHSLSLSNGSIIYKSILLGRGPGGQAINKTSSSVCLVHLPTGIRVQAQPTRSREQNRTAARHILRERLDLLRTTTTTTNALLYEQHEREPPARQEDQGVPSVVGKAAVRNKEEEQLAGLYAKEELRAAKIRQRKLNLSKKHRKKQRRAESNEENRDNATG